MSLQKVKEIIQKNKSFLITSHINLEGDSIGSQLALYALLKALGKEAYIIDEDAPAELYSFLPMIDKINTDLGNIPKCDVTMIIDCPVIKRSGEVARLIDKKSPLCNIDHHVSNTNFGDINWVDPMASSGAELVYRLFKAFNQPIDRDTALVIYVAILTDTGSFGYENTNADTHKIVAELLETGIRPLDVRNRIYENRSLKEFKLLEKILSTLKSTESGKVSYLCVTKKMLSECGCEPGVTEGFINYPRSVRGTEIAILFLENPYEKNKIQISLRSKGKADVNKLAARFGGGGHHNASGCVMDGKIQDVIKKVLAAAEEEA